MILKTTTNEFCFINVSFYETIADPRHFFEQDYEEMPEYEEESDFDFDSYYNKFRAKEKGLTIEELSI